MVVAGTTGLFTTGLTGLLNGTTYAYRAYATNVVGTTYTDVETFKTVVVAPVIASASATHTNEATDSATAISSVTLGGNITTYGEETITRGVVYAPTGVDSNPYIGDPSVDTAVSVDGEGANGAFTMDVEDLEPYRTYSFRAYVTNSLGTSYTSVAKFTTPAVAPLISSPTSGTITASGATLGGNVTNTGGRPVSCAVWSTRSTL